MARYRLKVAFDHQALDASAKSEIREAGKVVEITDGAIAERYLQSGAIELVTDEDTFAAGSTLGEATNEERVQQGDTLEPGQTGVLTQEEGKPAGEVVADVDKDKDDVEDEGDTP